MTLAAIGLGANLGESRRTVRRAIAALSRAGTVVRASSLYASKPWGDPDQPDFCNAVALLETSLAPLDLLRELKVLESELGRVPSRRWGPRAIDLDILVYGEQPFEHPELQIPHPRLHERAFALAPLAELDPAWTAALARLPAAERESVSLMSEEPLADRVRVLAQAFLETDLMRLRIEDENDDSVELRRKAVAAPRRAPVSDVPEEKAAAPVNTEKIKADLVGVFHLTRPPVHEGDELEGDRELAYVEALGIRNPVRSLGAGRIVAVRCKEGDAVEYGQVLFEIVRA
ncbi:MAG TPA: 2-amino-4-hydroxy-6-hydroxymethyldihydropteridine diphosphokinase [Candidatus Baltobacteraceae bacterium]|nr:2-amino-4-hydroxy-6-hydroxymethyldihydropteridine diphosphokinase [Candidatus Baltobacteraceae bacterium]